MGLLLPFLTLTLGCQDNRPPPPDRAEAAALLRTVLETWQAGQPPATLASKSPPVTVNDPDWARGVPLARFEIEEDAAQPAGFDLSCPARLWLGDGKKTPLRVRYLISLKPARVVVRAFGD